MALRRPREHGGDGFSPLLRVELATFCARRTRIGALGATAVLFVLVAVLSAFASHANNPAVPTGRGGEAVTDAYMFVHQTLAGDGTITARVTSLSGSHTSLSPTSGNPHGASSPVQAGPQPVPGIPPWAKAGILLEPNTNPGTAYVASMVTGSHGVRMQYDYTHDRAGLAGRVGPSSPRWLRLNRAGDVITTYDATDGAHWAETGAARLAGLPHTVQVGLFVTSPDYFEAGSRAGTPSVATASFDHISTDGDLPQRSWTADPVGGVTPDLPSGPAWQEPSADSLTITGSGDIAPLVGGQGEATHWSGASVVNGTIVALLVVIMLAALFAAAECRRGVDRTAVVAGPGPGRVVAAKAVVAGSLTFAAGAVAAAIAEVVTRHIFAANGNYLFPQSGLTTTRVVIGTGLFLGLSAMLLVALGAILRRGAAAVVAGLALLVLPGVAATIRPGTEHWLMRLTPTAAFAIQATLHRYSQVDGAFTIANGYFPISPFGGLAVLAAYTSVALSAAVWLARRHEKPRDRASA